MKMFQRTRMRLIDVFTAIVVYFLSNQVHCSPIKAFSTLGCGYNSCNPVKDDMLNVHLVPHTHDDVGWLKTVDQYYYGYKNSIQNAGVQYILDSVIPQLINDPTKRFIYVEIAFFERWWNEQSDSMRHIVQSLVNEGRLEFILGGWCMNDEASTHYNAIIDQHTIGFEFLRQNFGECGRPRVAWQIDPFGHSREQASLFARMGFDGLFFGRLDQQDKMQRLNNKTMELMWKGSPANLGNISNLFTGINYNLYQPPPGFCFDILCKDDPIMDDERMHDYNVKERVDQFLTYTTYQASFYKTNHIMMTMGSDFQYSNADTWYKNLDKLIKHTNARQNNGSKVNLLYSTPSCYLNQLNRADKTWTTKEDDFFPYSNNADSYWTGYFTSRPSLKGYVRQTNNLLQVVKQLDALSKLTNTDNSTFYLNVLKKAMGVLQHHDAVSGTEKQAVAYDYAERLAQGVKESQKVVYDAYRNLLPLSAATPPPFSFCSLTNISACNVTEYNKQFVVIVYNPMSWQVNSYVRLPVVGNSYTVTSSSKKLDIQVLPITNRTKEIPERKSIAQYEILFPASLPPLGFQTYFVRAIQKKKTQPRLREMRSSEDVILKNEFLQLTFNGSSGRLTEMKNLKSDITIPLKQGYYYYDAYFRNGSEGYQSSGAYIFRPNSTSVHELFNSSLQTKHYYLKGQYVQEVHQTFHPWATQVVRLYEGERHAEFEWTVGPIDVDDGIGKEVISRFETGLSTNATFYTDSNGREILKRIRDYRPTWKLHVTQPVAGNYYPVNSRIYIRDEAKKIQLTVLTDRSQGGASIQDGNLELMVHRRLLMDDMRGVGEALNELGSDRKGLIVRGKHYVILETIDQSASVHRDLAQRLFMAPSYSFVATPMKEQEWMKDFRTMWSGLQKALPRNIHLLTLEKFTGKSFLNRTGPTLLLRLEHIYEKNEDQHLSQPVTVNLDTLFVPFKITNIVELVLGGNLKSSDLHRLKWKTTDGGDVNQSNPQKKTEDNLTIVLTPMQIRTFEIELKE